MKIYKFKDMVRGWFVGNFSPSALVTNAAEVAVREYKAGEAEKTHYHKIATEVTFILEGEAEMNGERFGAGDILVFYPNELTTFKALTDVKNVVVKIPGANNDKYEVD